MLRIIYGTICMPGMKAQSELGNKSSLLKSYLIKFLGYTLFEKNIQNISKKYSFHFKIIHNCFFTLFSIMCVKRVSLLSLFEHSSFHPFSVATYFENPENRLNIKKLKCVSGNRYCQPSLFETSRR